MKTFPITLKIPQLKSFDHKRKMSHKEMQGEKKLWINPNLNLTGSNIFNCFVWWLYCLH